MTEKFKKDVKLGLSIQLTDDKLLPNQKEFIKKNKIRNIFFNPMQRN